jgi:hypothetical protein
MFLRDPVRTLLADALKPLATVEQALRGRNRPARWRPVGGCEAVVRFD